jgi:hypothetical protein
MYHHDEFCRVVQCGFLDCDADALKVEAMFSSGTLIPTYKSARRQNQKDHLGYIYCYENLMLLGSGL